MDPIDRTGPSPAPLTPDQQTSLKKLHEAATQLEGVFVGLLFKEMRAAAPPTTIFGKVTEQEKTFNEMLDQARADSVAKNGAFGFAKAIEAQMRSTILGSRSPQVEAAGAPGPATAPPAAPRAAKPAPEEDTP